MPRDVVAIGKCAGALLDGVAEAMKIGRALCAIPRGYREPKSAAIVARGGHPDIDDDSFRAGQQLLDFVDQCEDILFLISGGGSACVEVPLPPFTRDELSDVNARLVASDLPIGAINTVRKHLSAIKGGRLGARVHGRSVTLIYSDVSAGAISDVASGPTIADHTAVADAARILERLGGCEQIIAKLGAETVRHLDNTTVQVIADNTTLTNTAAALIPGAVLWPGQIEMPVEEAARALADCATHGSVLVAGGEPTVARRGSGKGGRCCELAVRFALRSSRAALFGSSDGVDGSSGISAIVLSGSPPPPAAPLLDLLERSESLAAATLIGRAIIIPPAGNNLRDLFLVASDNATMAHH
jgi:hydroxypyruvate reductase